MVTGEARATARDGEATGSGAARRAPLVSVVLVGDGRPEATDRVLAALLADPAEDFEVILVDPEPARPRRADRRVYRFGGAGLPASEARALGFAAARARQQVLVELGPRPGATGVDEPVGDAAEAALLVRPALELLRILRAVALATGAPSDHRDEEVRP